MNNHILNNKRRWWDISYKKVVKQSYSKSKPKYKYLGKKVKDKRKMGLDSMYDFYDISSAIMQDYKKGKISKKVAQGRLLLLYRLTFKKNNSKIQHLDTKTLNKIRKKIKKSMSELWWG